jgi:site-specific DNA recombinase
MRAALYARYSSDRQNERSIEDQLAVLRRHAAGRAWDVVATFSDAAISGAAMLNRPGLQTLMAAAVSGGIDVVLVEDEDRLARNLEHQANIYNRLKHAGVAIATLGSDAIGILEVGLRGVMAELYLVNLSAKTSRGMRANAEAGRATGSRLYGYRSEPGGAMTIVAAEAEVIIRIHEAFGAGATGREIAASLNADAIPSPRGGLWNASAVNGSRQRGNGILHTELYAGVKTWNRVLMRKDPSTGKRLPTVRPKSEWRRTPVEHLRIVPPELWDRVQARLAIDGQHHPLELAQRRKTGVFSGLLKCGVCGASYTVYNMGRLICAAHREKGDTACANRRTLARAEVERRVLGGLRERLLSPAAVAAYVRVYHAAYAEAGRTRADARAPLEKRIGALGRSIERIVDAVCQGHASAAMLARLSSQEAEKLAVETELAALEAPSPPPVTLHPNAAQAYADLVEQLQDSLARISPMTGAHDRALIAAVRQLVTRIDLTPTSSAPAAPVTITLHGDLARFLRPPGEQTRNECGSVMVAGGGIEPPTCGL